MGEIAPYISLATLLLLALNFAFGRGDKSAGRVEALTQSVHQIELSQKDMEARIRGHVGDQFATKDDIRRLEGKIGDFAEAQRQYHEGLMTLLKPVAEQLIGVSSVRR